MVDGSVGPVSLVDAGFAVGCVGVDVDCPVLRWEWNMSAAVAVDDDGIGGIESEGSY